VFEKASERGRDAKRGKARNHHGEKKERTGFAAQYLRSRARRGYWTHEERRNEARGDKSAPLTNLSLKDEQEETRKKREGPD